MVSFIFVSYFDVFSSSIYMQFLFLLFLTLLCFTFAAIFAGSRIICFCLSVADSTLRFIVLLCYLLIEILCKSSEL